MNKFQIKAKHFKDKIYLEYVPGEGYIDGEVQMLEILSEGYHYDTYRFLFHEDHFSPELFDLKTGLAGAIFQKLAVYRIRAVVIIDPSKPKNDRFIQFMTECNHGDQLRFFPERKAAEKWLVSG